MKPSEELRNRLNGNGSNIELLQIIAEVLIELLEWKEASNG